MPTNERTDERTNEQDNLTSFGWAGSASPPEPPAPAGADGTDIVLQGYPLRDGGTGVLTSAKVTSLEAAFPRLDVVARLRQSLEYAAGELAEGRTKKLPTRRGFGRWLTDQCRMAAERGWHPRQPPGGPRGGGAPPRTVAERLWAEADAHAEEKRRAPSQRELPEGVISIAS